MLIMFERQRSAFNFQMTLFYERLENLDKVTQTYITIDLWLERRIRYIKHMGVKILFWANTSHFFLLGFTFRNLQDLDRKKSPFNEQNNKQYESSSQDEPTLREFINPSDIYFDIAQATLLGERPGNIKNSSFTGFLLQKMEFMREQAGFKNYIIERLFTTNSFLHDNQFISCKSERIKIPSQRCSDESHNISEQYRY